MQIRRILISLLVAAAIGGSGLVTAASKAPAKDQSSNMPGAAPMGMGHDMMDGGMMHGDMMGMMSHCKAMMSSSLAPQLPPGNEKLQLQMQAEIMQKTGEIIAKYAERISADQRSAQ